MASKTSASPEKPALKISTRGEAVKGEEWQDEPSVLFEDGVSTAKKFSFIAEKLFTVFRNEISGQEETALLNTIARELQASYGIKTSVKESSGSLVDIDLAQPLAFVPPDVVSEAVAEVIYACHHKILKESQLDNWAKSRSFPTNASRWFFENQRLLASTGIKVKPPSTQWLMYRVTAQGTTNIVKSAVTMLGTLADKVFTKEELEDIEASSQFDLSSGIPDSAIAKAKVIIEFSEIKVGTWYQGKKAMQNAPMMDVKRLGMLLKKAGDVAGNIPGLDSAKDPEAVLSLFQLPKPQQ